MGVGNADDEKLKADTLRVLDETEETHSRGQAELTKGVRELQKSRDAGRLAREMIEKGLVDKKGMQGINATFKAANDSARTVTGEMGEVLRQYSVGSNVASIAVSTAATGLLVFGAPVEPRAFPQLAERARAVFGSPEHLERVRRGLKRCRLDEVLVDVNRSALSLVEESAQVVGTPISPDSSSAIVTLRDGIKRAIVDLFNRCQGQDTGSKWEGKLRSIFKRAGRDDVGPGYFDELCSVVHAKVHDMATAKDKVTDRLAVLVMYQDRLLFLLAVLDGIDERKLT